MPRIRAENMAAHRALMRGRLLDAFGELMHEHGYAAVTLAMVAKRAGMARNTIYNYAADKQALLMAFVQRSVEEFVAEVRIEMGAAVTAADQVRVLVTRQVQQFAQEVGAGSEAGMLEGSTLGPSRHAELKQRFAPLHGLMAEAVRAGMASGEFRVLDPEVVVPMAFSVISSERLPVGRGERNPDQAAAEVTDFLLHAFQAEG